MKYLLAAISVFFIAIVYVSVMPYLRVLGVTPHIVLIFVACWAVIRGRQEAFVIVPIAGVICDLLTSDPLGTSVLALAPLVLLAAAREAIAPNDHFLPTLVVVAIGSLAYGIISLLVLVSTGQGMPLLDAFFRVVMLPVVVNVLFTPLFYFPLQLAITKSHKRLPSIGPTVYS